MFCTPLAGGSLIVNRPPRPVIKDGPYILSCPGTVTLNGSTSYDDDGDRLTYRWELISTTNPSINLIKFKSDPALVSPDDGIPADNYQVTLTVMDSHGSRMIASTTITVLACPGAPAGNKPPTVAFAFAPYTLQLCNGVGSLVLDGTPSVDPDAGGCLGYSECTRSTL